MAVCRPIPATAGHGEQRRRQRSERRGLRAPKKREKRREKGARWRRRVRRSSARRWREWRPPSGPHLLMVTATDAAEWSGARRGSGGELGRAARAAAELPRAGNGGRRRWQVELLRLLLHARESEMGERGGASGRWRGVKARGGQLAGRWGLADEHGRHAASSVCRGRPPCGTVRRASGHG